MNLKQLAQAASNYYDIDYGKLVSPCRKAKYSRPRHICQWIAADAGYKQSDIARFWGMNHASIIYGCKMVQRRIDNNEVEDLKNFMKHAEQWD